MEKQIEEIIANNLIELRKSRNLKQSELSEQIGYSDKTISRWEKGVSVPDIATLVKIAEFYNISIETLITENAVQKSLDNDKKENQEKIINDYSMVALSFLTVWLIAAIIYIALIITVKFYFWQVFVWAIPLSTIIIYKRTRKMYSLKWLNFLLLSIVICSTFIAIYLQLIEYNLWQLFFVIIPLEGMSAISTLFKRKKK